MNKVLKNRNFWSWGAGLLLALALFASLQYAARTHFADPDGFYHARSSQIITSQNHSDSNAIAADLVANGRFPWLYFTTWNEGYANQHYLYNWLLAPFNTVQKLPISVVVFGLIFVALFTAVLAKYKIRFKPFWVFLLLASSVDFLFRINLVKANTLSLALLCVTVILVYAYHTAVILNAASSTSNKQIYSLLGIGFVSGIFVWTYGGFVCVPMLLGAYAAAEIIAQRNFKLPTITKASLPALVSIAGIALGMLLHPQSHNLFVLLYDQLFRTGLGAGSAVPAGNEWLPFQLRWFFQSNILILFAWLFSVGVFVRTLSTDWNHSQKHTLTLWLQITALGLMALTLWHRRFVEYWIPFAVFATVLTLQPYLSKLTWPGFQSAFKFWQTKIGTALIIIFIVIVSAYNVDHVVKSLRSGASGTAYQAAAQWLAVNSEPGDIVLNTQWDQFPQLFYYDTKNYYIVGLDPTFMYIHDPDKYWQWRLIADDDPAQWESLQQLQHIMHQDLKAKFIFIDTDRNPNLANYLENPVFTEQKIQIFELSD